MRNELFNTDAMLNGMMGLITGDALGCPVQFMSRSEIRNRPKGPVSDMEEFGTYHMPKGTWTDDSSMALAALASNIACGLYYFMVKVLAESSGQYEKDVANLTQLAFYGRTRNLASFSETLEKEIVSSGYVVASFEAALWCLVTTASFKDCLLKAVNLGDDTDTVAAIAGGLAGLFYGYEAFPKDWLKVIAKREWIEELCGA